MTVVEAPREQTRARYPDQEGFVERDGVRIFYEVYGSGAPTILDGIVYFSTLHGKTFGLDVQTGKKIWEFDDGKYSPVVADKVRVYLAGYKRLYGLLPDGG